MTKYQSTTELSNKLYYGDCLTIMREMRQGSVDLIYLDPPFNSARDYNAIYKDETGRPLPTSIDAFCDTWTLDSETEDALRTMPNLMKANGIDHEVVRFWSLWMNALRKTNPALLAYLSYMTQRLLPMRGILKPTGSIYLHCDPTASHYIKIMMDAIFGHKNFQNEIIWSYRTGGVSKKRFARKHDVILFYSNSKTFTFNLPKEKAYTKSKNRKAGVVDYGAGTAEFFEDADGVYNLVNMRDVWDISYLNSRAGERMGYATQKPVALLERIIEASSNEGDVVLDPFCGCATTIEAAHKLNRKWIGIDIAIHAIKRVATVRLSDRLGLLEDTDFTIEGVPRDLEGARDLWKRDKYHFQKWAVEAVDGFVTSRQSGDGGVDGRLYFTMKDTDKDLSQMLLEVKGGRTVNAEVLRSLRGTMEREGAEMAGLIIMDDLSPRKMANFKREMATAGVIDLHGVKYDRMQMLTVKQISDGEKFITPSRVVGRGLAQPALPLG